MPNEVPRSSLALSIIAFTSQRSENVTFMDLLREKPWERTTWRRPNRRASTIPTTFESMLSLFFMNSRMTRRGSSLLPLLGMAAKYHVYSLRTGFHVNAFVFK
ncbi:hypothetical protein DPMN_144699 [Dreissena polymorpha]|uniref:Uncharacterized protein n=1 Tax=Dreissena polymorpha TaxID=45954 RepID=A0A9D4F592_DREPO|nr:hypothetical protein DPMN_144699 [Dreissena polymorpha]